MAFANGRIPGNFLVQAANGAPGQVLEPQTAAQWAAMVAAAAKDGVTLRPQADGGVSSCYRSYGNQEHAKQVQLRGGPTAAYPGTSNHGLGIAIDIVITAQTLAWLNAHAAEYGFDNAQGQATSPSENWHWVRTRTIANITNTTTATEEDEDMRYINCPQRGRALVTATGFFEYTPAIFGATALESAVASSKLFQGIDVTAREWDIIRQDALNRQSAFLAQITKAVPTVPAGLAKQIAAVPGQVWAVPVQRGDKHIPAIQELADAKTIAIRIEADVTKK